MREWVVVLLAGGGWSCIMELELAKPTTPHTNGELLLNIHKTHQICAKDYIVVDFRYLWDSRGMILTVRAEIYSI